MNEPDDQLHPTEFINTIIEGSLGLLARLRVQGGLLSIEQTQIILRITSALTELADTVEAPQ